MLLLPFLQELWLEVTLGIFAWLVLPLALVWKGRPVAASVTLLVWAVIFCGLAYISFEISTRLVHPNRDAPIAAAFLFLIWSICALASIAFSATLFLNSRIGKSGNAANLKS
ncbi:MAG: hypothetical protein ACREB7_16475 [Sphingopyxis sp.]|uniref:hypothetical protein n=1 Tax=Sphingopyxis sp. TaxID=1908224 RepID=UPI003D6CE1CD